MPRLQAFLECVGQTLCEKGRKALQGQWSFVDILPDIARGTYEYATRKLPGAELRLALADCAAVESKEYERRIGELISDIAQSHAVPKAEFTDYMRALPTTVRQALRRPTDPDGRTASEKLTFYKAEEISPFLPPRLPRFHPGDRLDNWTLTELRGMGQCSEVWRAEDPKQGEHSPTALKFVTDSEVQKPVKESAALFTKVFDLNSVPGILPLRSVYLESDPPCLESPYVFGYDLAGLLFDWKWRYDTAKPEAALKLIKRLASIVAEDHSKGMIHRDLKPTNVLLHPTEGGKFTLWITDFGWGQIESLRCLELAKSGPRGEQQRLAARGAATALYASPQQVKREPPAPTDDVHALGVIWYQLLKRDRTESAPVGTEWIEELRPFGFTDSQARVLQACLSTRPDKRPKNAAALVEQLNQVTVAPSDGPDGSKLISLRNPGSAIYSPSTTTSRGKTFDAAAAAASAAALLTAAGGGPLSSGGPGTSSSSGVRLVKNSIGMTFVRISGGSFRMGSPDNEQGHREQESPLHEVRITKPFYISAVPVTQAHYEAVKGKNPSKFNRAHGGGPDHPVESLTWDQAVRFCEKLGRMPDEEVHHRIYRLPTEAEWEYVCRAGTISAFSTGDKLTGRDAVFAGGGGKYSGKSTSPVAHSLANAWGIHDMHGNVQEWVHDWFEDYYYFESPADDPQGPKRGTLKTVRGGCWGMFATDCRSAARRGHAPDAVTDTIGFRVVMVVG
ncbi:MAG TPA: SUMF1/EgtB/PvdO family nonheme iron enzyme [Gemmata sp.]|jgi:formylglycine-generating enzyme required for sulfatase activity|nr:SUMF1/EgtB/PvdO family nonheme iron enzyme [Gemmata sp.]